MCNIFVKWHIQTNLFNRNFENQYETPEKHWCGNVPTPTCDITMHKILVPYSSNVCENSLQSNVWIYRLPMENVSTMSLLLVGRNFSSADILLTFILCQCNVMTLLNNCSGMETTLKASPCRQGSVKGLCQYWLAVGSIIGAAQQLKLYSINLE